MKLKVIAKNNKQEQTNIEFEGKIYVKNSIIETDDKKGKEMLKIKLNNFPIVEEVKK